MKAYSVSMKGQAVSLDLQSTESPRQHDGGVNCKIFKRSKAVPLHEPFRSMTIKKAYFVSIKQERQHVSQMKLKREGNTQ